MDGERARRKVSERVAGRSGRIGGERFAGGHAQAQPARLFPLPVGSHSRLDSQPRHLVWLKEGPRSEGAGEDIDAARQRERMRQAHPVKCAVDDALRGVDVIVPVDVEQPRRAGTHAAERGDDSQRDRAVPAQHEHHVTVRQQGPEPFSELSQAGRHLIRVLSKRVIPVRTPHMHRQIPVVAHFPAGGDECLNQAGRAQRPGCLVLACRVTACAARHSHHRDTAHPGIIGTHDHRFTAFCWPV